MKNTIVFPETEFQVEKQLQPFTDVVIVPDSPAELCPAPVAHPVQAPPLLTPPVAKPTGPAVVGLTPVPVAPQANDLEDRIRWSGSDYVWFGLVTAAVAVPIGIVAILLYALMPVFQFLWSVAVAVWEVVSFLWSLGPVAGPVLGGGLVVVALWKLSTRLAKSSGPSFSGGGVASAPPVPVKAKVKAVVTGKPVSAPVKSPAPQTAPQPSASALPSVRPQRGGIGRLFLGDDRPNATPAGMDPLTSRWLARMRNKESGQAIGAWNGGPYAAAMADIAYGGDFSTAYTMHGDDKCAVSWLLEEADPKGWNRRDSRGTKHGSWSEVNAQYGSGLIKRVMRMNDSGVRLPDIADYVESKVGGGR